MRNTSFLWIPLVCLMCAVCGCSGGGDDTTPPPTPSPSLDTWHLRTPLLQSEQLSAVIYANDLFVAVGGHGTIITSSDGVSWTALSSITTDRLNGLTYGDGLYAAVGENGTILTSPDAVSWSEGAISKPFYPYLTEVAFGNHMFVASGIFSPYIYSYGSPDGVTWINGPTGIHALTYAGGTFLAVQTYASVHGYYGWAQTVVTSPDGLIWTPVSTPNWPYDIRQIAYGKDLYVGVGGTSTSAAVITSPDGVVWTERTAGTAEPLSGIAYGDGFFVAVGNSGTILVSSDGMNWTNKRQDISEHLLGVTYGNGTFVAVGWNGVILQSDPL